MKNILENITLTKKVAFYIYFIVIGFISLILFDAFFDEIDTKEYKTIHLSLDIFASIIITTAGFNIINSFKKLIADLNKRVEEKTKDLEELNKVLEEKVRREVEQNRKKDKIMYQHSRLASMGEMVGNIAHQWRQPLNSLSIIIQSFGIKNMTGKLSNEFIEKQVEEGLRISNMMSRTIDDFRNFFNPDNSKEYFNLKDTINDTIQFIQEKDIQIILNCKNNINIYGHKNEFSQVMLNLLNNSIDQFNKIKGKYDKKILINIQKSGDTQIITFIDNAGGIQESIMEKIFDPYFTTKHQSVGTGIGLFMTRQIIQKQMRGNIYAKNIVLNFDHSSYKCAKFIIELPIFQTNVKKINGKLSIA